MEIERKWVVKDINLNDLPIKCKHTIEQAYLVANDDVEIRIRCKDNRYYITHKSGGSLAREEFETEIDACIYNYLWKKCIGNLIRKTRFVIPYGAYSIELDVFCEKFCLAEVEFKSIEDAQHFVAPDWFLKEVTDDPRYKNKSIAMNGFPL